MKKGTSNLGFKMSRKDLAREQVYGCEERCVQWKSVFGELYADWGCWGRNAGGPLGFFRTGVPVWHCSVSSKQVMK